jgi:hypothetical protein
MFLASPLAEERTNLLPFPLAQVGRAVSRQAKPSGNLYAIG